MTHLSDGVLRRLIDEPLALGGAERAHYESCAGCRARANAFAADAVGVAGLLAVPQLAPDTAAALRRVRAELPPRAAFRLPVTGRGLRAFASVAVTIIVIVALSTTGLADSFLQIFEPKRFVAIPISDSDLRALPTPYEYGTITWSGVGKDDWAGGRGLHTQDLAAARANSGLPVALPQRLPEPGTNPDLQGFGDPRNYPNALPQKNPSSEVMRTPTYHVLRAARMTFTFSGAMAREAADRRGKAIPPMPADMDGSSLFVDVGPVVVATYYGDGRSGVPGLVVVEARPPVVSSDRVTVVQLRDYLVAQPGISKALAERIKALAEPESTLPVPVPVDRALTRSVSVNGRPALLIGDSSGAGSVVFWRDGDLVRAVAGPLNDRQVLDIASSLQ